MSSPSFAPTVVKVRFSATVAKIVRESPQIITLELDVSRAPKEFYFFPGQWVTMFIRLPGEEEDKSVRVPITSAPLHQFQENKRIRVSVRRMDHPVLSFIYKFMVVGMSVRLRGSDSEFYFMSDMSVHAVCIVKEHGICNVMGIVRYVHELYSKDSKRCVSVDVFYTCNKPYDMAFYDDLMEMATATPEAVRVHTCVLGLRPEIVRDREDGQDGCVSGSGISVHIGGAESADGSGMKDIDLDGKRDGRLAYRNIIPREYLAELGLEQGAHWEDVFSSFTEPEWKGSVAPVNEKLLRKALTIETITTAMFYVSTPELADILDARKLLKSIGVDSMRVREIM